MRESARDNKADLVRVGVIGAGFIAQIAHLYALRNRPGARIAALADTRPALLSQVGAAFEVPALHHDPQSLIGDGDIDAFVVCVHRRCLAPLVLRALKTGKPVLSEMPMAYTRAQAERLVSQCRPGQIYAVGYMIRHDPGVRLFRRLLAEETAANRLGAIVHVAMRDFCPTYGGLPPAYIRSAEAPADRYEEWPRLPEDLPADCGDDYEVTLNVLGHDLNLARWLFGAELTAEALRVRAGRTQTAILTAGPFDVVLQSGRSDSGAWDQSVEVMFEQGRMTLRLASPLARGATASIAIQRLTGLETIEVPERERVWAFQAQIAHFLSAIRASSTLECSGADSLNDVSLVEELWRRAVWRKSAA